MDNSKEIQEIKIPENSTTDENQIINNSNKTNKTKLILSGGGIKGIAHIGALSVYDERNMLNSIDTYCGSSIGALICSLLVAGTTIFLNKKNAKRRLGELLLKLM